MVTIGMNYEVIDGKQGDFESMFAKVLEAMQGIDGHGASHLYRDVTSDTSYLIVSEWSNEDAFNGFIASERFKNVANWGKEQILSARPKHQVYGGQTPKDAGCPVSH